MVPNKTYLNLPLSAMIPCMSLMCLSKKRHLFMPGVEKFRAKIWKIDFSPFIIKTNMFLTINMLES